MKKLVKVALFVVVMVMGLAFSLYLDKDSQGNITLDYENSGQPEWFELVEVKDSIKDLITLDYENSGQPEWFELVEVKNPTDDSITLDYENSGLPETIELRRISLYS
jgi:ABC-type glycerol-3-phosphate transport system substrate-binding protein